MFSMKILLMDRDPYKFVLDFGVWFTIEKGTFQLLI